MQKKHRIYSDLLENDYPAKKMAFLSGPRQVGKTTIARQLLEKRHHHGLYLNYDIATDRRAIPKHAIDIPALLHGKRRPLIIFDEIHKMRLFKHWLKGFFDQYAAVDTVVTVSVRRSQSIICAKISKLLLKRYASG